MKKKIILTALKAWCLKPGNMYIFAFQLDVKNYTHIRMKLSDIYKELAISKGRNLA